MTGTGEDQLAILREKEPSKLIPRSYNLGETNYVEERNQREMRIKCLILPLKNFSINLQPYRAQELKGMAVFWIRPKFTHHGLVLN